MPADTASVIFVVIAWKADAKEPAARSRFIVFLNGMTLPVVTKLTVSRSVFIEMRKSAF